MQLFHCVRFSSFVAVLHTGVASFIFAAVWYGICCFIFPGLLWLQSRVMIWAATNVTYLFGKRCCCNMFLVGWFLELWWVIVGIAVVVISALVTIEVASVVIEATSSSIADKSASSKSSMVFESISTSLLTVETVVAGSWVLVARNVQGIDSIGKSASC